MISLNRPKDFLSRTFSMAVICLLAGIATAFSMAPAYILVTLVIGLSTLYICLNKASSPKWCFIFGWLFGFGYFTFSLYWIGNALLIEGNPYKWAWPLAVTGLPALLSFFVALPCYLHRKLMPSENLASFFTFIAFISTFEILRGYVFTGFPWNLFGYAWGEALTVAQFTSLLTIYGLSTFTIFWATVPGHILVTKDKNQSVILIAIVLASFLCVYAYGNSKLNQKVEHHEDTYIQIVQANIAQNEKWERDKIWEHFQKHIDLSAPKDKGDDNQTTIIVWPETAISFHVLNDPSAITEIQNMLNEHSGKAYLLTGLLDFDKKNQSYTNSIIMIDQSGRISNLYNKHHLVPFGEYIPFQNWIPIPTVTQFNGLKSGLGPQKFTLPNSLSYAAAICYEIIFPGEQISRGDRVDMIINVTNDAWYGDSAGPYQHFAKAQFRAIENQVTTIRSANTGFSGLIYPNGIAKFKSELFSSYSEKILLPKGFNEERFGPNKKIVIWLGFLIGVITLGYIQKRVNLK